jgi:isoleucyl-tRNA synthetase
MRKEMDLKVDDQIRAKVDIESKPILDLALLKRDHIASEVRASAFELGLGLELGGAMVKDWDIEGVCVRIGIDRA